MSEHRIERSVDADAKEVIWKDKHGNFESDYYIQGVDNKGLWKCSCGAGPFETETGAKRHLTKESE